MNEGWMRQHFYGSYCPLTLAKPGSKLHLGAMKKKKNLSAGAETL